MAFTCPYCGHQGPPNEVQEGLSGGGWAVFIVLLLFCLPLCWLPFIMDSCKKTVRRCASCGSSLGEA